MGKFPPTPARWRKSFRKKSVGNSAKCHKDTSEIRTGKDLGFGNDKFWKVHFPEESHRNRNQIIGNETGIGYKELRSSWDM